MTSEQIQEIGKEVQQITEKSEGEKEEDKMDSKALL